MMYMKYAFLVLMTLAGTGVFGDSNRVDSRLELDPSVLLAGEPQVAMLKVTLDAPPLLDVANRSPVTISVVMDRSGSMSDDKQERESKAVKKNKTRKEKKKAKESKVAKEKKKAKEIKPAKGKKKAKNKKKAKEKKGAKEKPIYM